jgi:hypothetical protein
MLTSSLCRPCSPHRSPPRPAADGSRRATGAFIPLQPRKRDRTSILSNPSRPRRAIGCFGFGVLRPGCGTSRPACVPVSRGVWHPKAIIIRELQKLPNGGWEAKGGSGRKLPGLPNQ